MFLENFNKINLANYNNIKSETKSKKGFLGLPSKTKINILCYLVSKE